MNNFNQEAINFVMAVRAMRMAQRDYFRFRTSEYLVESKKLEKKVDSFIQQILDKNQNELFMEEVTNGNIFVGR